MLQQPLQQYTFLTRYSRTKADGRKETWEEAVQRMLDMHRSKYGPEIDDLLDFVRPFVLQGKVVGSQRALQFGGEPILRKNERIYNCSASPCDRLRFFQEAFFLLLCGCGTGFSVQRHHVDKLPLLTKISPYAPVYRFSIPDTIEGWADALGVLLSSYCVWFSDAVFPEAVGCKVEFDYSNIRPAGSPISSGVGVAPGPDGLRTALEHIRNLLDEATSAKPWPVKLRPIQAYDIVMHASNAVLSGGVRRSATICLFSPDDQEMAKAKTGDWFTTNPQRARSNNSVVLVRNRTSFDDFAALMRHAKEFGEPGVVWSDDPNILFNPCVEVALWPYTSTGVSGWQFCNLSEINMAKVSSLDEWLKAAEAAAILGTLQAGYTSFPYLGPVSEAITRREALLGVSLTGMADNPELAYDPASQQLVAKHVLAVNERIAARIGINPAARATCVKPSGTTACLLGTSSGVHPRYAPKYLRRVQTTKSSAVVEQLRQRCPAAVEHSVWAASPGQDAVAVFAESAPPGAYCFDRDPIGFLHRVVSTQRNWVSYGRAAERCAHPALRHNVSNTVVVPLSAWDETIRFIYNHRDDLTGVSLLPETGDVDFPQAPFVAVVAPAELKRQFGEQAVAHALTLADQLLKSGAGIWHMCPTGANATPDALDALAQRMSDGPRTRAAAWELLVRAYALLQHTLIGSTTIALIGASAPGTPDAQLTPEAACAGGVCVF